MLLMLPANLNGGNQSRYSCSVSIDLFKCYTSVRQGTIIKNIFRLRAKNVAGDSEER